MKNDSYRNPPNRRGLSNPVVRAVLVAVAVLGLLVLVERSRYFRIRPVSGSASALSQAAVPATGKERR